MIRRFFVLFLLSVALAGCGENLGTYHFRLTVEVDTPEGLRSGSSVLAVSYSRGPNLQGSETAYAKLHGEAVFVDLGKDRHLVALLTHGPRGEDVNPILWLPVTALTGAPWGWGSIEALKVRGNKLWGAVDLQPPLIPTLVSFDDLNDPASARVVETVGFFSNFGPGYQFRRVTLEMVPAGIWPFNIMGFCGTPVTKKIEGRIPMIMAKLRAQTKVSGQLERPDESYKSKFGHFIRGS